MTLPNAIQIGPIRYRVTSDKADYYKAAADEGEPIYGRIAYGEATITLEPGQALDHMRLSLLHEVLHGCWHTNRQEGGKVTEEQAIRNLTASLLDTLRRNPDLVTFLTAETDAE